MRHPRLWMGLLVGVLHSSAWGAWDVNMPRGATEVSRSVFDLHMTIFWICVVIGVLVFSVMIWSSIVHRRSVNRSRRTSTRTPASRCSGRSFPC